MLITVQGKNRLGFVDGSYGKNLFHTIMDALWDKCNEVIFGWMMNSFSRDLEIFLVVSSTPPMPIFGEGPLGKIS